MNRVEGNLGRRRARGDKALLPFVTAGDPDLATTQALLPALERAGASACEIGIPFSDPIADGPVIESSMARALARGTRPRDVLAAVSEVRPHVGMGLIGMVSYSIVFRAGAAAFVEEAAAAGLDGLIVPDLPLESTGELRRLASEHALALPLLVAPGTPDERAAKLARASSGFVYLIARAGITGEGGEMAPGLGDRVALLRRATDTAIAVGFGIADVASVRAAVADADAAIVGSAIVRRIAESGAGSREAIVADVEAFVRELCQGLD